MTTPIFFLALSAGFGLLQIIAVSHAASLQRGYRWTASDRDGVAAPLTGIPGRILRAQQNFAETFPIFAALVLAVEVAHTGSELSIWGVNLYFWTRIAYFALYILNWSLARSLIWNVAFFGMVAIGADLFT
jgi:uncharacterized MAPEG superfamily protein